MRRIGLNNLVVADRSGVAGFDITPHRVVVRPAWDCVCVCKNHFCTEELRPRVTTMHYPGLTANNRGTEGAFR
jgi:hypothetical protein